MSLSTFPSTAELLIQGADSRLCLDPISGTNHYLCRPQPDPELLRLGSSTASNISVSGFDVADHLRNQMAEACRSSDPGTVYQAEADRIRHELRHHLHLGAQTAIEMAESGTDAHRLAVCKIQKLDARRPLRVLMVAASETGSGVPEALCPSDGEVVCSQIAIRDDKAMPLPAMVIDDAVLVQTEKAIRHGEHVLLVMVDQSKSGCIAPSLSCGLYLKQRFSGQVHLLLDGCQFRFSSTTLNHYLEHGIMVAITGSKFLAGPSFSAALLLPDAESESMQLLPEQMNPGLFIRWQVALASLHAFSCIENTRISQCLNQFADAVMQRLESDEHFVPLPSPPIDRGMEKTGLERERFELECSEHKRSEHEWSEHKLRQWDKIPTIFPFMLRLPGPNPTPVYASHADTLRIYHQLQQGAAPRVQLGRPIHAGRDSNGIPIGALRLCISAPMVIDAINDHQQAAMIEQCMQSLDLVSTAIP